MAPQVRSGGRSFADSCCVSELEKETVKSVGVEPSLQQPVTCDPNPQNQPPEFVIRLQPACDADMDLI